MTTPDLMSIRQACALLERHLVQKHPSAGERIWLKPGLNLKGESGRTAFSEKSSPLGAGTSVDTQSNDRGDENVFALLEALKSDAISAGLPNALGTLRDTFVFSAGSPLAELVFVGEAPGAEEEKKGEPFVGPAGELLGKILKAMGLSREMVYITNIVKYRPKIEGAPQGAKNRKPTEVEMAASMPFILRELGIIRPKVVVALGGTAYAGLSGDSKTSVGQARGRFHDLNGIPMMATFHPSYLLRQDDNEAERREKRKLWEDMLMVMEKLGLPISEKQRGFFAK